MQVIGVQDRQREVGAGGDSQPRRERQSGSARVEGAVGMVEMALKSLSQQNIVTLDEDKKATMVNNLMVALVSEHDVQPVINTGTLYQ